MACRAGCAVVVHPPTYYHPQPRRSNQMARKHIPNLVQSRLCLRPSDARPHWLMIVNRPSTFRLRTYDHRIVKELKDLIVRNEQTVFGAALEQYTIGQRVWDVRGEVVWGVLAEDRR